MNPKDELDEMIEYCTAVGVVDVNNLIESDPDGSSTSPEQSDDKDAESDAYDSDVAKEQQRQVRKKSSFPEESGNKAWQQNFQCMQKHDGEEILKNPNMRTIQVLQE